MSTVETISLLPLNSSSVIHRAHLGPKLGKYPYQPQFQTTKLIFSRTCINATLRSHTRDPTPVSIDDEINFWRDGSGCLGPALVTMINTYHIGFIHSGTTKTSSHNRIRRLNNQTSPPSSDLTTSFDDASDDYIVPDEVMTPNSSPFGEEIMPSASEADANPSIEVFDGTTPSFRRVSPTHSIPISEIRSVFYEGESFAARGGTPTPRPRSEYLPSSTTPTPSHNLVTNPPTEQEHADAILQELKSWNDKKAYVCVSLSTALSGQTSSDCIQSTKVKMMILLNQV